MAPAGADQPRRSIPGSGDLMGGFVFRERWKIRGTQTAEKGLESQVEQYGLPPAFWELRQEGTACSNNTVS